MTDRWLAVLNGGDERLVCRGPGRRRSMPQLRNRINELQVAIVENGCRKWVLYNNDGFDFICALFALLLSGCEVRVAPSRHSKVIDALLGADGGLIGFHPELRGRFDIEISPDAEYANSGIDTKIAAGKKWGKVSFSSSGSSGQPKQVSKRAEQLYLEAEMLYNQWRPSPETLFVPLVTHHHIYGLAFALLLPLIARASFYLPRTSGILGVVEPLALDAASKTDSLVVVTNPTIGRRAEQIMILAEAGSLVSDDRPIPISKAYSAGGKLTATNAERMSNLFACPVTEIFGSTETGAVATREHAMPFAKAQNNPWRLLPGVDAIAINNQAKARCGAARSRGEFAVWGRHVGGSKYAPILTGDEVEFIDNHRFELLGRVDRICKIEGKRVSLDKVEEIIENCDLVTDVAVLPVENNSREVLLCGVVLSKKGIARYHERGKFATDQAIRAHLLQFLELPSMPRHIRYVDQMPRNQQGKLSRENLFDLLVDPEPLDFPLLENSRINQDKLELGIIIPMELCFLKGHFDNFPVVPGVILLHWVYHYSGKYWNQQLNPTLVNRLKFSSPIRPGDRLMLILQRAGNGAEFFYQNEQGKKIASGLIPGFE